MVLGLRSHPKEETSVFALPQIIPSFMRPASLIIF